MRVTIHTALMSKATLSRAETVAGIFALRGVGSKFNPIATSLVLAPKSRLHHPAPIRLMGSGFDPSNFPPIVQIGKEKLKKIIKDLEKTSREESGFVIIDVRGDDEIASTGKISPVVETLPLAFIVEVRTSFAASCVQRIKKTKTFSYRPFFAFSRSPLSFVNSREEPCPWKKMTFLKHLGSKNHNVMKRSSLHVRQESEVKWQLRLLVWKAIQI